MSVSEQETATRATALRNLSSLETSISLSISPLTQADDSNIQFTHSMMDIGELLSNFPWLNKNSNVTSDSVVPILEPANAVLSMSTTIEPPQVKPDFEVKIWGWSFAAALPWAVKPRTTLNKGLKRRARGRFSGDIEIAGNRLRFRPYVSKEPWHTGPRAVLSQFFPRYGHYCGPNWSSGKDRGTLIWDKRPIDWLDYCCYCHDMGYDSNDQAELLKADLEFLECLERKNMATRGDAHVALIYKTMCTSGLKNSLIPYRTQLVKLQSREPLINFGWLSSVNWRGWRFQKT